VSLFQNPVGFGTASGVNLFCVFLLNIFTGEAEPRPNGCAMDAGFGHAQGIEAVSFCPVYWAKDTSG
jgi:hypothetical protein